MTRFTLPPQTPANPGCVNVLVMTKGEERYVVMYDDLRRDEALRQIGDWAFNEELSFTWQDAAILSQKMRGIDADV